MCYDISFTVELRVLGDYFPELVYDEQIKIDFSLGEHIAGHAFGNHPVIYRNRADNQLHCRLMEWGCIPFYVKDLKGFMKQRNSMLNARSERVVDDKTSYWYKIRNRRCLVPVTGIYEHRAIKGWKKKVPYFITQPAQPMFFLPGLYSMVETADEETGEIRQLPSFTIITRAANSLMKNIHNDGDNRNRMPLFLTKELSDRWLEKEEMEEDGIRAILDYEMPADELEATPVFTIRSSKTRPDNKSKNEYWEWEKLPELGELNPD